MPRSKATSTADRHAPFRIPPFRLVGGKGGVGKTTCAAAMGLAAARSGRRTLIVSTDPAPSLADALGQPLGRAPRAVRGVRHLHAVEVDAAAALERWIETRRGLLEEIALRGTWLDRDDVTQLLRLSLPGVDEIAGLLQLNDFHATGKYDHIIVDAAPTGHLLRMLGMPAVLEGLAQVFDHMQAKHRIMVAAIRGGWTPDAADVLIDGIDSQARQIGSMLRDPEMARLSWVTLPEPMAVEETADGIRGVREHGVTVDQVILNRLTPPPPQPCRWCRARRKFEQHAVAALEANSATRGIPARGVPVATSEPRGVRALSAIGRALTSPNLMAETVVVRSKRQSPHPGDPARVAAVLPAVGRTTPLDAIASDETRLLMFGGKGGVGKTTCAAAAAIEAALASTDRRVLLLSADPAHSVGDVLGQPMSDKARSIKGGPPNLMVRELDPRQVFAALRQRFSAAIEELFVRLSGAPAAAQVATHDRQVMHDLLDLAPPGVDELVAIIEVTEALLARDEPAVYHLVVIDTAPTGHALRLIEMPSLVHEWVRAVMAILLKYQPVVGVGDLGAVLLQLSRGLGRLRELMTDPVRCRFVSVTRPAVLPRAETTRLLERLRLAAVSSPIVILNAVGAGTCSRCRGDRAAQRREIGQLVQQVKRGRQRGRAVVLAPAEVPPPFQWPSLNEWRSRWRLLSVPPRSARQG